MGAVLGHDIGAGFLLGSDPILLGATTGLGISSLGILFGILQAVTITVSSDGNLAASEVEGEDDTSS